MATATRSTLSFTIVLFNVLARGLAAECAEIRNEIRTESDPGALATLLDYYNRFDGMLRRGRALLREAIAAKGLSEPGVTYRVALRMATYGPRDEITGSQRYTVHGDFATIFEARAIAAVASPASEFDGDYGLEIEKVTTVRVLSRDEVVAMLGDSAPYYSDEQIDAKARPQRKTSVVHDRDELEILNARSGDLDLSKAERDALYARIEELVLAGTPLPERKVEPFVCPKCGGDGTTRDCNYCALPF